MNKFARIIVLLISIISLCSCTPCAQKATKTIFRLNKNGQVTFYGIGCQTDHNTFKVIIEKLFKADVIGTESAYLASTVDSKGNKMLIGLVTLETRKALQITIECSSEDNAKKLYNEYLVQLVQLLKKPTMKVNQMARWQTKAKENILLANPGDNNPSIQLTIMAK